MLAIIEAKTKELACYGEEEMRYFGDPAFFVGNFQRYDGKS
jgi:hypothetical protein